MAKDRIRHSRIDLPVYQFVVYERPRSLQGKGTSISTYLNAITSEARKYILTPILSNDIEVEICWATNAREGIRADIDNIIKPTLDALIGVAYDDDKKVRSVTATLFELNQKKQITGYVEDFREFFYSNRDDAVQIAIYSDARMSELGGYEKISKERSEEFQRRFQEDMDAQIKAALQKKDNRTNL
jgi:Holliday junction resolvase RusA-like endonuclease